MSDSDKEFLASLLKEFFETSQDQLDNCEAVLLKFEQDKSREKVLLEMISDILASCNAIQKEQEEHKRFGFEPANFEVAVEQLKTYIQKRCRDERIYLD